MALSNSDVEYIAHLARLEVSDDEIADYAGKLSSIIDLVSQLSGMDTSQTEPMAHPLDMVQRLREDDVTESDRRDDFQENSQSVGHGYYRVPKVIDPG